MRRFAVAAVLALASGCAARQPGAGSAGASPDTAQAALLEAAALADRARAAVRRLEHEKDAAARADLVREAIDAGQRCEQVAPGAAGCDYARALSLGVEAREHPGGALPKLPEMVRLLRSAAEKEPRLDDGGPNRVLALLLVRAPGWPVGPGDPEAALESARRAVEVAPDHAPNQLALAEARRASGDGPGAVSAAQRAVELARAAIAGAVPDADDWRREGEGMLADLSR